MRNKDVEFLCQKFNFSATRRFFSWLKKCYRKNRDCDEIYCENKQLRIKRAPEPSDILWENLQYSKRERKKYGIFSFLITCLYLIIAFLFLLAFIYGNRMFEVSIYLKNIFYFFKIVLFI